METDRDAARRDDRSGRRLIEDPVRIYLTQLGNLPLLTQQEELSAARSMATARLKRRWAILTSDFVLRGVVEILDRVCRGQQRLDWTAEVSSRDKLARQLIWKRLTPNLKTIRNLLRKNEEDDLAARCSQMPNPQRRLLRRRIIRRRRRAASLVEELFLRESVLDQLFEQLKEIQHRMEYLESQIRQPATPLIENARSVLCMQLNQLMRSTLETPRSLARRVKRVQRRSQEFDKARRLLSSRNLRLVVSIAKRYRNRGVSFLDLIQEGNIGLMRAVDKYRHDRGFRFSTYATWWIRQQVCRAIDEKSRMVRLPVHLIAKLSLLNRAHQGLVHRLGRDPSIEEIAEHTQMTKDAVRIAMTLFQSPLSLDTHPGDSDEMRFGDLIEDAKADDPVAETQTRIARCSVIAALSKLTGREQDILAMRFGLNQTRRCTLEEIGVIYSVSRERIRQIEQRALKKLQKHCEVPSMD